MATIRKINAAKSVLLTYGTQLVLLLVRFGTGIVTARLLGVGGKGIFVLAFYLPDLLSTVTGLGMGQSLIYRLRRHKTHPQELFLSVMLPAIAISLVVIGAYWLALPLLQQTTLHELDGDLARLTIFVLPAMLLMNYVPNVYRGLGRMLAFNLLTLGRAGFVFVALVITLFLIRPSARFAVYAGFAAYLFYGVVLVVVLLFASYPPVLVPLKKLKDSVALGLQHHSIQVLALLEYRFDIVLLGAYLDAAQIGLYSVAVTVAQLPWLLSNSMGTVLFPKVVTLEQENAVQFTGMVMRNNLLLNGVIALGLVLCGLPLIVVAYGADFRASYFVLLILVPGTVINSLFRVSAGYFAGTGEPLLVSRVSLVTLVANVALNLLLIPRLGIRGAALASLITYSLSGIVMVFLFTRRAGLPLGQALLPQPGDWHLYRKVLRRLRMSIRG